MQLRDEDVFDYHERPRPGNSRCAPEALLDAARPLDGLHAGRRAPVPGDRAGSGRRLPLHRQGQPGRGGQQRHRRARPRQHRPAGRQARHGGQGACCSSGSPTSTSSTSRSTRPTPTTLCASSRARADLRRHQPRGHQGARVLRDRADGCRREMDIPVFHDDQHGTAIISGAALLNALRSPARRSTT